MKVVRDSKGRFGPGHGGGPGRPKGRHPAAKMREYIPDDRIRRILERITAMAEEGDVTAARLLIDRLFPIQDARIEELREAIDELRERLEARRSA